MREEKDGLVPMRDVVGGDRTERRRFQIMRTEEVEEDGMNKTVVSERGWAGDDEKE